MEQGSETNSELRAANASENSVTGVNCTLRNLLIVMSDNKELRSN